jgi:tetratricopeptide (TPR) repeat protein
LAWGAVPASADILELKDGRLVEGVVLKDGETYFVTDRYGAVEVAAKDVKEHIKGKSVDEMVREHVAKLKDDDVEGRLALATWLEKLGRVEEAKELGAAVLDLDPENEAAHKLFGHVRHRGAWVSPDDAKRAEGYERHGGKWYTPAEWKHLADAERKKAAEAEATAQKQKIQRDVNAAVRLMMSPDPKVRERGRLKLLGLAREHDSDELQALADRVAEHVKQVEELRKKALAASSLAPGARGTVMTEIRATMSRLKRPIQVLETSLASNIGGSAVKIQLPELEVVSVRTTGIIPAVIR